MISDAPSVVWTTQGLCKISTNGFPRKRRALPFSIWQLRTGLVGFRGPHLKDFLAAVRPDLLGQDVEIEPSDLTGHLCIVNIVTKPATDRYEAKASIAESQVEADESSTTSVLLSLASDRNNTYNTMTAAAETSKES